MYGLTGEPLQTLYKIGEIFILLGVQLMATARARVRYVTVHMMAPNGPNRSCTYPGIYIGMTGNIQGTTKVFDIKSGKVKKPRSVTAFNVPDRVIDIVDRTIDN